MRIFLPILKYLKEIGKEVVVLSQFAGSNFRDFVRLEKEIKFEEKTKKKKRTYEISASLIKVSKLMLKAWIIGLPFVD